MYLGNPKSDARHDIIAMSKNPTRSQARDSSHLQSTTVTQRPVSGRFSVGASTCHDRQWIISRPRRHSDSISSLGYCSSTLIHKALKNRAFPNLAANHPYPEFFSARWTSNLDNDEAIMSYGLGFVSLFLCQTRNFAEFQHTSFVFNVTTTFVRICLLT